MALKRQFTDLSTFSMSSMTDVIFLLLIFFMVTSTLVFPSAIDVTLPESSEQTSLKPVTEVYITADTLLYIVENRSDTVAAAVTPALVSRGELQSRLANIAGVDSTRAVALYADTHVEYGKVVEVLDLGAAAGLKMVLATRASQVNPKSGTSLVETPVSGAASKPIESIPTR